MERCLGPPSSKTFGALPSLVIFVLDLRTSVLAVLPLPNIRERKLMRYPMACPVCQGDLCGEARSTWGTCRVCGRSFDTRDLKLPSVPELERAAYHPLLSRWRHPGHRGAGGVDSNAAI